MIMDDPNYSVQPFNDKYVNMEKSTGHSSVWFHPLKSRILFWHTVEVRVLCKVTATRVKRLCLVNIQYVLMSILSSY